MAPGVFFGSSRKLEERNRDVINNIKETLLFTFDGHAVPNISDLDCKIENSIRFFWYLVLVQFSTNSQTYVKNHI